MLSCNRTHRATPLTRGAGILCAAIAIAGSIASAGAQRSPFRIEEATIADVHRAMMARQLTATALVSEYLKRVAAYNGACVKGAVDPATGFQLGDIEPVEHAGKVNALITLNLRGKRSKTDSADNDPNMPDALETAKALDAEFARTGRLKGPLHGIPFAIKDQFDTFDMRSTSGAAANYANDRPPRDAEVVARLRQAGAIILAKANMGEYAAGDRSTFGGTTCNPYDTSRSAGRSSGGSGAAVAANLVMCAIGEETGPSARNPAANDSLVGIVATHSLVSRAGIIPASLTRDRPGILCRTVKDAATVLTALAGYDPRDAATAASVGQTPDRPYQAFADNSGLKGARIGIVREFMQPFTKADEDSIRIADQAIADLANAGAAIVDPGPGGALFRDAIATLLPAYDAPMLASVYKELFPAGAAIVSKAVELTGDPTRMPAELSLRILVEREPPNSGEVLYVLDRYLRERGDKNIKSVADLISNSTFFSHAPIDGIIAPPKARLEDLLTSTERFTKKSDGSPYDRRVPITSLDGNGWHVSRTLLQALVNKVMADQKLDALFYPTKTIPAPLLAAPVEPANIKVVKDTVTVVVDGEEYARTVDRLLDVRAPLAWRLSPNGGLPAIAVPAGFTREVYDRAINRGEDGSKKAGDLVGPKAVELPVSVDFLGRPFSEPMLIRIAAAYERATRHRKPPKDFSPQPPAASAAAR
jgi:Asp-tRNA(Asn)/Glu-tRNA(Gln) amidotransferase A subunit family amidase